MICNRSLKQTVISLSSCEAEFCVASTCAVELVGLAEFVQELHYTVSEKLEMDSDPARHVLQRRGPGGLTKNNTADIFTKYFDGLRILPLSKNLGLHVTRDAIIVEQVCDFSHIPMITIREVLFDARSRNLSNQSGS